MAVEKYEIQALFAEPVITSYSIHYTKLYEHFDRVTTLLQY